MNSGMCSAYGQLTGGQDGVATVPESSASASIAPSSKMSSSAGSPGEPVPGSRAEPSAHPLAGTGTGPLARAGTSASPPAKPSPSEWPAPLSATAASSAVLPGVSQTRREPATPRLRSCPRWLASTSTETRRTPSLPVNGRTSSRPLSSTGSPLRRQVARLSASLRQQVTRTNEVLPSTHSPLDDSLRRVVQATFIVSFGMLLPTLLNSGSLGTEP